jgi:preflagellin peptidase FlaK
MSPFLTGGISPISQIIFPITIFGNAVLFAAATGVYMVLHNILWHKKTKTTMFPGPLVYESIGKKLLVLITGYKMSISKVKSKWHIFPMEDIGDQPTNPKRTLVIMPRDEGREKILENLSKAYEKGVIDKYIWATPGLPMLIFVTLGLIVALLFGDFVWLLVRFLVGA